jgi:hypothetical protein
MSRKYIFYVSGILLLGLFFGAIQANAHDWYPSACCGGTHCHPITSCSEIIENAKGVVWDGIQFTKDMIKPSQDNQCHVCIVKYYDTSLNPKCVFIQQGF